jgi:hypothetical protein
MRAFSRSSSASTSRNSARASNLPMNLTGRFASRRLSAKRYAERLHFAFQPIGPDKPTGDLRHGFAMSAMTRKRPRPVTTQIRTPEDSRAALISRLNGRQEQAGLSPPGLWQANALHDDVHHSRTGSRW